MISSQVAAPRALIVSILLCSVDIIRASGRIKMNSKVHGIICRLEFFRLGYVLPLLLLVCANASIASDAALLQQLVNPGHFAVMRHALAPGMGDPENLTIGDCATQRNLDDTGRQQARYAGDLLRSNGVMQAKVYSSEWCRCLETAELLGYSGVTPLPSLNSFFREREKGVVQTAQLEDWIASTTFDQPVLLVTHQVNITALTDVYPASGEIVVLKKTAKGGITVLGTVGTAE